MPATADQIASGATYTLESFNTKDPIDQIGTDKPFLEFLMSNKEMSVFGNGFYNEGVYVNYNSNYQNYYGADQVTYNQRDPVKWAKFSNFAFHDGFWLDEHTLSRNGIILTDDRESVMSGAEKVQLFNLLKVNRQALKDGIQQQLDIEVHLDGSANAKSVPGLDLLISTTPATTTVGGIDASTATYWRNNVNMGITASNLIDEMEKTWRACMLHGGQAPDKIFAGSEFIDAYRQQAGNTINRQIIVNEKGGTGLDASVTGVYFKGVPIVWNPTMDALDDLLGVITYPWKKRCYFVNSKNVKFRPVNGRWMIDRKPERLPDRYVHYWGKTGDYGFSTNKRNANAVLSVA